MKQKFSPPSRLYSPYNYNIHTNIDRESLNRERREEREASFYLLKAWYSSGPLAINGEEARGG